MSGAAPDPLDRIAFMRDSLGNKIDVTMPQEVAEALVEVARAASETARLYPYEGRLCRAALARLERTP